MRGRRKLGRMAVVLVLIGIGIGLGQVDGFSAQEPCRFERRTTISGDVYEKPSADADVMMTLDAGTELTLVRGSFGWYMAILPDERLGWVFKELFLPTAPAEAPEAPAEPAVPEETAPPAVAAARSGESRPEPKPESEPAPAESKKADAAPVIQRAKENPEMVVLKVDSGRVRESPSLNAAVEFGLVRGEKVAVMDIRGPWYHIKKSDGRVGWSHRSLFNPATMKPPATGDQEAGEPAPGAEPPAPKMEKQVESVRVDVAGRDEEKLIIRLNGFYPPETYVLEEDVPKVVCDFADVTLAPGAEPSIVVNGTFIRRVRTEPLEKEGSSGLRVVVELVPEKDYEVEQIFFKGENLYVLTFTSA